MSDPLSLITRAIAAVSPSASAGAWAAALTGPMRSAGITTPNRIAMFLGQVAFESGGFRLLTEDLYYTTAVRIHQVWPTRFANAAEAVPYASKPAALANHVYANRTGNGSEESGDGWRFRGRGLIQITFRSTYARFAKAEPRATDPDWLTTLPGAAVAACWFWTLPEHNPSLNALSDAWDITGATRVINGGLTGIADRAALANAARSVFGAIAPVESEADRLMDAYNTAPAGPPASPETDNA